MGAQPSGGSVFRHVDFTSRLVGPSEDKHPSHGDVLADHQTEFGHFGGREMLGQFGFQAVIRRSEIQSHLFGEAHGQRVSGVKFPLGLGTVHLLDGFFVESLTRRRRVPGKESGVALVEGRHF